jgi:hypothetical protein
LDAYLIEGFFKTAWILTAAIGPRGLRVQLAPHVESKLVLQEVLRVNRVEVVQEGAQATLGQRVLAVHVRNYALEFGVEPRLERVHLLAHRIRIPSGCLSVIPPREFFVECRCVLLGL